MDKLHEAAYKVQTSCRKKAIPFKCLSLCAEEQWPPTREISQPRVVVLLQQNHASLFDDLAALKSAKGRLTINWHLAYV